MIVLMNKDGAAAEIDRVVAAIDARGLRALRLPGGDHVAVGIASAIPPEIREELAGSFSVLPGVSHVVHVSRPYKLASREFHAGPTVVRVGDGAFGGPECVIIAGPCAVESREQIFAAARAVKDAGARLLRGGAFKPRTSPYSFQGLHLEGLQLLQEVREEVGIGTVTEVIDPHDVEAVAAHVDMLQIGAR